MQIDPKDTYRVISETDLSQSDISILSTLYQPVTGGDGILVYFTLSAESKNARAASHARLFAMMNSIDADVFVRARMRLEAYGLLKTFVTETNEGRSYIYSMIPPLSGNDFFASRIANEYLEIVGKKIFNDSVNRFCMLYDHLNEYKDITTKFKPAARNDLNEESSLYHSVKPLLSFTNDDSDIAFDYNRFISNTSALVFPIELRTQENMAFIGRLATVHGISADRMKSFVSKCCNLDSLVLNYDKLKRLCEKAEPDVTREKDIYKLPPVSFLQSKQNGAAVSLNDKKILEHLSIDMHFNNEVINIMIEYILKISDNRLNEKFVYMVAGEWARDNVKTREDALKEADKKIGYKAQKRKFVSIDVPDYMQKKSDDKMPKQKKGNAELIRDIQNDMKKMGGN